MNEQDVKKVVELKEGLKKLATDLGEATTRALSLVRTKIEEACMWADYELRLQGVNPDSVSGCSQEEVAPEAIKDSTKETDQAGLEI